MKAYLAITGIIFALIGVLHVWRAIDEWHLLQTNPALFLGMAGLGAIAAALSVWAWVLFRSRSRL